MPDSLMVNIPSITDDNLTSTGLITGGCPGRNDVVDSQRNFLLGEVLGNGRCPSYYQCLSNVKPHTSRPYTRVGW